MEIRTDCSGNCKSNYNTITTTTATAYERGGGSGGTSVRGPESQEGGRESQTGPLALAIDILFSFFHFLEYFQLKSSILREVSVCPWGPTADLFRIAKFLLEALTTAPIKLN